MKAKIRVILKQYGVAPANTLFGVRWDDVAEQDVVTAGKVWR